MNRKSVATVLFIFPALIGFGALASLAGKWQGSISLPDGNTYAVSNEFTINGSQLGGKATAEGPFKPINEGKVNGPDFRFSLLDDDGQPIPTAENTTPKAIPSL